MTLSRRELLARGAAGAGVLAVGNLSGLLRFAPAFGAEGPGPLVPDPNGLLDLARGFSYKVVSQSTPGGTIPSRFDGTAAFAGPHGLVRLVRNHEQGSSGSPAVVAPPELTYDAGAAGGTSTLSVSGHNELVEEHVSLGGTWSNCMGGRTPWGTWLTCEETETKAGQSTATMDHGYVFEVDANDESNNVNPTPITGLGRYAHEAAAVDPQRGDVYLTEDANNPHGLVFRFRPNDTTQAYGTLRNGGTLTAMTCSQGGTHVPDLCVFDTLGTTLQVSWVPVPDPVATSLSVRKQFADGDVTRSRKFEGAYWGDHDGRAYIVCSFARLSDGSVAEHDGQVWAYDPADQTLELVVRFGVNPDPDSDLPDGPDNIAVSPYGGLFLCEDGEGVQHMLAVKENGDTAPFARNAMNGSEFTGVTFSPDQKTLFFNIQTPGWTFAVTGPFRRLNR